MQASSLRVMALAIALCSAGGVAAANSYTYSYASGDYTSIAAGSCLTTPMKMSLSLQLAAKLPANFTGTVTPVAWRAGDGKRSFTNTTISRIAHGKPMESFYLATDSSGAIQQWAVTVSSYKKIGTLIWGVLANNVSSGGDAKTVEAVDNLCGGGAFAVSTDLGGWKGP